MGQPKKLPASLDDRIQQQLQQNVQQHADAIAQANRDAERLESVKALNQAWIKFGSRRIFQGDLRRPIAEEQEGAINDLMAIGRLLCNLGMMSRVTAWGGSKGLAAEVAVQILQNAADQNRRAVENRMRQVVFDQSVHTLGMNPYEANDLTAVYAHLAASIPMALNVPFTRASAARVPERQSSETGAASASGDTLPQSQMGEQRPLQPAAPDETCPRVTTVKEQAEAPKSPSQPSDSSERTDTKTQPKRKGGRPPVDLKGDEQAMDAWEYGGHRNLIDVAKALRQPLAVVEKRLDRERKRRKKLAKAKGVKAD